MTINLNNLNLSLDTFNDIASGNYNIGEVRLTADGQGLTKVNNHKNTWFFSNNTSVSSEEALAIKNAFVKALSDAGMKSEALAAIREQLGITNASELLSASTVKPLSRQEIRDIIDQNAATINTNRTTSGQKALKTSDQIYAKMSKNTRATHQTIRDLRNEELASTRKIVMNHDIKNLMTILTEGVAGKQEQSGDIVKMCFALRSALATLSENKGKTVKHGKPMVAEENDTIQVTFRSDDNRFYTVDTKLTKDELFKKLISVTKSNSWEYTNDTNEAIEMMTDCACKEMKLFKWLTSHEKKETQALVKRIFTDNIHDKVVTTLLSQWLPKLMVTGEFKLRTGDALLKKVEALKQNVEELRQLESKYPGAFKAGMETLDTSAGKAMRPNAFSKTLEMAEQLNFEPLGTSTKLSLDDIHKHLLAVVMKTYELDLPNEDYDGEEGRSTLRDFYLNFALQKLTPQIKRNIHTALHTQEFSKLYGLYQKISTGNVEGSRGFTISDQRLQTLAMDILLHVDLLNLLICNELKMEDGSRIQFPEDGIDLTAGISDEILNTFNPQQANIQQ